LDNALRMMTYVMDAQRRQDRLGPLDPSAQRLDLLEPTDYIEKGG
jgi:hypothetical protein